MEEDIKSVENSLNLKLLYNYNAATYQFFG